MTKLTDQETEVLSRLSQGYSQKEVARQMGKSPENIQDRVTSIRKKFRGLDRAFDWYREQHQEQFEADELADDDEPVTEPVRCRECCLAEPHRCLAGSDFMYRKANWYPKKGVE